MEKDQKVLDYISKNQYITQRELATRTGLSLGNINLIIRKLVKKGLIEIDKLTPNTFRYILTPKGLIEKTTETYRCIKSSVRWVRQLKQQLEVLIEDYIYCGYAVYIYGEKDDIQETLKYLVKEEKLHQIQWIENLEQINEASIRILVVVWQLDKEDELDELDEYGVEYVNLLHKVGS